MIANLKLSNGLEVPAIGLGTYLAKNGDEAAQCICDAADAGYRSFDTAMFYFNEEGIGKGIKLCGVPRDEIHVTTKLWNDSHGYEKALKAFYLSLKRLDLEYIDEYLIHWPGTDEEYIPTWKAFEKLYREGLIRVIGVSNFNRHQMRNLIGHCEIKPMVNQIEVHPFFQPNDAIAFCRSNGILVEAWRPIVWGRLEKEPIVSMADKYGKTPVQVTLRWLYQKGIRTLPKTTHKERMIENMSIFDFSLTGDEIKAIDLLNTYTRTGETPDEFYGKKLADGIWIE
jgi:diketogulonate reductase-like aldo/keto reductase